MKKEIAKKLLDKVRDGQDFSFEQISAALYATGDIYAAVRGEGVDFSLQSEDERAWPNQSADMVERGQGRHPTDSGSGWPRYLDQRNESTAGGAQ
jgi:hypothetical protein